MGSGSSKKPEDGSEDAFPAGQLAVLALCRLAEPVAFISIVSYNFAMVNDIKGGDNVASYAGLLVSAFAVAEASSAMVWGALSDRYGRKPIILLGLTGTALSSLLLGFAKQYWVALLARFLGGLLNGNVGVMQTMVAEIVKNPKHEPRAYSIQPFMWSLGSVAGSALGGYAAQPARFYPQYFSPDGVFGRYPYLLPNLVAAAVMLLAITQAVLFLKETNPKFCRAKLDESRSPSAYAVTERTPLRDNERRVSSGWNRRRPSIVAGSIPTPTDQSFDLRRASITSAISFSKTELEVSHFEDTVEDEDTTTETETSDFTEKKLNRTVVMWIAAIALMCYHQMAFVSAFPIYLLDAPRKPDTLDLIGGLGMTVHDVGSYMAINSCVSLFIQAVVLPLYMRKLGVWMSIVTMSALCPLVDFLIPFITAAPNRGLAVYPAFALQAFSSIIIYPSMLIMLKNSVSSSSSLGYINGLAVSASSAARTIAPPLIGVFYSSFGSAGAWWSCAGFAVMALGELFFIRKPEQDDEELLRKASVHVTDDED